MSRARPPTRPWIRQEAATLARGVGLSAIVAAAALLLLAAGPASAGQTCGNDFLGKPPLTDLGAGLYQGQEGGLYPGGSNVVPQPHLDRGLQIAATIEPLDPAGLPNAVAGRIVLIAIGVSNTRLEFGDTYPTAFKPRADADPGKNPRVVIVDGSRGGHAIDEWLADDPDTWSDLINVKLPAAGVTALQVQAAWIKLPDRGQTQAFPDDQLSYRAKLKDILRMAKQKFPNLRVAYLSSRIYGGYSDDAGSNIEPYAYQSAYGVKWAIEDQINGDPALDPDPDGDPATNDGVAPWAAWGPYLWADGLGSDHLAGGFPGRSDGLEWICLEDFKPDGLHPNENGVRKVADMLLAHFRTDPTACQWFFASGCGGSPITPVADFSGSPTSGVAPFTVAFTDLSSGGATSWAWDLDGDGITDSALQHPSFNYTLPGSYTVRLTASNAGGSDTETKTAYITVGAPAVIAFDAASSADTGANASSSLSFSHVVTSSGVNRILLVGVAIRTDKTQRVSSVTYGGWALTLVRVASRNKRVSAELWRLVNPPTGANSVVVTLASGASARFTAAALSYANVHQATPLGLAVGTTTSSATSVTATVTSAPGEVVVDVVAKQDSSQGVQVGPGQTLRWNRQTTSATASLNVVGAGSQEPGAPAVTISWSAAAAQAWALVAVPLKPAP